MVSRRLWGKIAITFWFITSAVVKPQPDGLFMWEGGLLHIVWAAVSLFVGLCGLYLIFGSSDHPRQTEITEFIEMD